MAAKTAATSGQTVSSGSAISTGNITTWVGLAAQGWQCPCCRTIWSPTTNKCLSCPQSSWTYTYPYTWGQFSTTGGVGTTTFKNEGGGGSCRSTI